MIKFTILVRRNQELTPDGFLEHHRQHSALFATLPVPIRNNIRRYTLSHPTGEYIPGLPETSFDGMVELCFDDIGGLMALLASTEYQTTIRPDEERFLDLSRCEFFLGKETIVIP
jgi:hypothetical protein